ncbi:MAG: DUF2007 domain-containing protein [Gammaproteobacteria bacterium]|nr:DUF2007 domain-containing protein [Gammaproteobacteria bacterium]MDH5778219.1 DUF2007 domain-containing protein [Gammaproteobacteria bacterium]
MKFLYSPATNIEAHLLKDILAQEGLTCELRGEYLQGGIGELPPMGIVQLFVADDEYASAEKIVKAWEAGEYEIEE